MCRGRHQRKINPVEASGDKHACMHLKNKKRKKKKAPRITITISPPHHPLPKAAPTNIMLAQVLQIRRLPDEPIDLRVDVQLLLRLEVTAGQLLLDTRQHLQRARVLLLLGLRLVGPAGAGRHDAGPVTGSEGGFGPLARRDVGADDGRTTL